LVPLPDDLDGPYALDVVVRADEIVAMQEATAHPSIPSVAAP